MATAAHFESGIAICIAWATLDPTELVQSWSTG